MEIAEALAVCLELTWASGFVPAACRQLVLTPGGVEGLESGLAAMNFSAQHIAPTEILLEWLPRAEGEASTKAAPSVNANIMA
jgi:hypothetical protein